MFRNGFYAMQGQETSTINTNKTTSLVINPIGAASGRAAGKATPTAIDSVRIVPKALTLGELLDLYYRTPACPLPHRVPDIAPPVWWISSPRHLIASLTVVL